MARLTKRQKEALQVEGQEFTRVTDLAQRQGYSLHRMIGLYPYVLKCGHTSAFEGTLAEIEQWLDGADLPFGDPERWPAPSALADPEQPDLF
jgi:hypothetical protein